MSVHDIFGKQLFVIGHNNKSKGIHSFLKLIDGAGIIFNGSKLLSKTASGLELTSRDIKKSNVKNKRDNYILTTAISAHNKQVTQIATDNGKYFLGL